MNKSIFKGHVLKDIESKFLYESVGPVTDYHITNPFEEKMEVLAQLGINDWEQLYALLKIESLRALLSNALKIQKMEELTHLISICEKALPDSQIKKLGGTNFANFPLGARKPEVLEEITEKYKLNKYFKLEEIIDVDKKLNEVKAYDSLPSFNLANSVNHIHQLNAIKSQGLRGTCSSFAVSAANEYSFFRKTGKYYDFSEQHLFYESKILENDTYCGAWIRSAMQSISNKGQCRESIWSYNPNYPCSQQYGKPSNADNDAIVFKNTFFFINQNDINALKQTLSSGRIIPFSIPVYNSWYNSAETKRTGRITMPLPGEQEQDGHAMTLVGYQDDVNFPGGGYFIIRNSWGMDWARDSYYGAGYGTVPYLYISKYNWEAYAF